MRLLSLAFLVALAGAPQSAHRTLANLENLEPLESLGLLDSSCEGARLGDSRLLFFGWRSLQAATVSRSVCAKCGPVSACR